MPGPLSDHHLALIRNSMGESIPVPPKPRRSQRNEESRIQQAVIAWWALAYRGLGVPECAFFAVGNGGFRTPVTGAIMKREGVRRGTSDLILMAKRLNYGALFIEMKTPSGILSPEQRVFLAAMKAEGYATAICRSSESAIACITTYLTNPSEWVSNL